MPFGLRDYQITGIKQVRAGRRSFDSDRVQAEAIPLNVLTRIVTAAVADRLYHAAHSAPLPRETLFHTELAATPDWLLDATDNDDLGGGA